MYSYLYSAFSNVLILSHPQYTLTHTNMYSDPCLVPTSMLTYMPNYVPNSLSTCVFTCVSTCVSTCMLSVCRLRKLHCFESCSVQIGDKGFYTLTKPDCEVKCVPARGKKSVLHYVMKQLHDGETVNGENTLNQLRSYCNAEKSASTNCHDTVPVDGVENSGIGGDVVENAEATGGGDDVNKNCANAVAKYLQEELACTSCDSEGADDNDSDSDSSASAKSNSSLPTTTGGKGRKRCGKKKLAVSTAAPPTGQGKSLKRKRQKQQQAKKMCGSLPRATKPLRPDDQVAVEVLYTFSRVTVMWQVSAMLHPRCFGLH